MRLFIAAALLSSAAPAFAAPLPVPPESRWATLPRLVTTKQFQASPLWIKRAQQLQDKGECSFDQARPGWTRIELPFAVQLTPTGGVQQVQVGAIGCPALEKYVAGLIRKLGPRQIVKPKGVPPYWRGSRFVAGWQNDADGTPAD